MRSTVLFSALTLSISMGGCSGEEKSTGPARPMIAAAIEAREPHAEVRIDEARAKLPPLDAEPLEALHVAADSSGLAREVYCLEDASLREAVERVRLRLAGAGWSVDPEVLPVDATEDREQLYLRNQDLLLGVVVSVQERRPGCDQENQVYVSFEARPLAR